MGQALWNDTAFVQLADGANQSQRALRTSVQEMQISSEQLRGELGALNRQADSIEGPINEKVEHVGANLAQLSQDACVQLERRQEQLRHMAREVVDIGESL